MSPVRKPSAPEVRVEVVRRETDDPTKHHELVQLLANMLETHRHSRRKSRR